LQRRAVLQLNVKTAIIAAATPSPTHGTDRRAHSDC
jgi:hypothetical protein